MDNKFVEDNVYNPEAIVHPHTICIDIPMSSQEHFEKRKDDKYNLAVELQGELEKKYHTQFPNDNFIEEIAKVDPTKTIGEYTGNIAKDVLLLAAYQLKNPDRYAFRWFRNDGKKGLTSQTVMKKFDEIMDKLNMTGMETGITDGESSPTYLSSDDPRFWQSIGWKDLQTTESYLLMFPSDGMHRTPDPYTPNDPVYGKDPTTRFDSTTPALNERQKLLIRVTWK